MNLSQTKSYAVKKSRACTVKKILIFFVLEVFVVLLITGVVLYLRYSNERSVKKPRKINSPLTYSKLSSWTFEAGGFNGSWISDNEIFLRNSKGEYVIYNLFNKTELKVVTNKVLINKAVRVEISADKKYLLFTYDCMKSFRWSSNCSVLIYNIETEKQKELQNSYGKPLSIQSFTWDPVGNGYSYVYKNNIYSKVGVLDYGYDVTWDGGPTMFNGICDWVYEEEIFGESSALWYSPDGKKFAYASFSDYYTDEMSITYYGEGRNMDFQYPQAYKIRYPKAGRTNPSVQLYIAYYVGSSSIRQRRVSLDYIYPQPILGSVSWINNTHLAFVLLNRVQNKTTVLSYDLQADRREPIFTLENDKGWVGPLEKLMFSNDGQYMLYIYFWVQENDLGSYQHLILYNTVKRKSVALTQGKFTVTSILAWDKSTNIVYFSATEEDKAMNQQIYKVKINENTPEKPECLSCTKDKTCHYWKAHFSKNQSYVALTCQGPSVPYVKIFDKNDNEVLLWNENKSLKENLVNITLPSKQFLKFRVTEDTEVNVQLQIPSSVDRSGKKKYPLLVYVYGGPNANLVKNLYRVDWNTYFSMNYETILAFIDGRGSGLNSDEFLFANYRHLGGVEVEDQLNATRQLQEKFSFIDETRTGIWGWSYGGYVTGMALAKDSNKVFKCGVSVAPVTDWIYYDTMYTERYMGLPTENDNLAGYKSSSLLDIAKQLKGKKYSLVHGSFDDNVHAQHSLMLARSLQQHNVDFSQLIYPNEHHSLSGVRSHLHSHLESFFSECFA